MGDLEKLLGDYQVYLEYYNSRYAGSFSEGYDPRTGGKGDSSWDPHGNAHLGGDAPDIRIVSEKVISELEKAGYKSKIDIRPVMNEAAGFMLRAGTIPRHKECCYRAATEALLALTKTFLYLPPREERPSGESELDLLSSQTQSTNSP